MLTASEPLLRNRVGCDSESPHRMKLERAAMLEFLRKTQAPPNARPVLKRSFLDFILEYGRWYEPSVVPTGFATGTRKQCFRNAADLAQPDGSLVYCEGYALFKAGMFPVPHAWVTDGQGRAIDNTWPTPGVAYAGVPFTWSFVTMMALKNNAFGSLLDDGENKWPLRGDLGDRPDEWLEDRGCGVERVSSIQERQGKRDTATTGGIP